MRVEGTVKVCGVLLREALSRTHWMALIILVNAASGYKDIKVSAGHMNKREFGKASITKVCQMNLAFLTGIHQKQRPNHVYPNGFMFVRLAPVDIWSSSLRRRNDERTSRAGELHRNSPSLLR
jgi:hypothetical protein